jgi:hypothetical protein
MTVKPIRGAVQRGDKPSLTLTQVAKIAADKDKPQRIIKSFRDQVEHNKLENHRDVTRILGIIESNLKTAVKYIQLLAEGKPLPPKEESAGSAESGRKVARQLAQPE